MNDLSFRPMATADIESVAVLSKRADPFGWTVANFQSALAAGYDCVVALAAGKIAGYRIVMQVLMRQNSWKSRWIPSFRAGVSAGRCS